MANNLPLGQRLALSFNFIDANGNPVPQSCNISWSSGSTGVATVLASGASGALGLTGATCEVTPVSAGTSVITASGTTPEGVSLSQTFTVTVVAAVNNSQAVASGTISGGTPVRV